MKMQLQMSNLIVGGEMTETDIGVGDPRMIIHHLVKSVYQFAKITMVQEIASNARDANVEAGNAHIPIEIRVPNNLEPNLVISDHGIGIAPARMFNIFVKIGNSTKRDDNMADGAFGIGSKIPLAYCDQFTVKTIVKEDGNLVRRMYAVVKRDDFSIKLMELGESHIINSLDDPSDQHTGTSITIPIKNQDITDVRKAVIEKTEFWDVRPTITGADANEVAYQDRKWFYTCDEFLFDGEYSGYRYAGLDSGIVALINGIPYTVTRKRHTGDTTVGVDLPNFHGRIYLKFKTGELPPALNRESLQYDDRTCAILKQRTESAIKVILSKIGEIINKEPTYLTAWKKMMTFEMGGWCDKNVMWQGFKLVTNIEADKTVAVATEGTIIPDVVTFMSFRIRDDKMKDRVCNILSLHSVMETFLGTATPLIYTEKRSINLSATKFLMKKYSFNDRNTLYALRGSLAKVKEFLTKHHLEELIPRLVCLDTCGYVSPSKSQGLPKGYKIVNKWRCTGRWRSKLETHGTFQYNDPKDCGYYFIYERERGDECLFTDDEKTHSKIIGHGAVHRISNSTGLTIFGVAPGNVKYLNKNNWKPLSEIFKNGKNAELLAEIKLLQTYYARNESNNKTAFSLGIYKMIDVSCLDIMSSMRLWIEEVNKLPPNEIPKTKFIKNIDYMQDCIRNLIQIGSIPNINTDDDAHPVVGLHKKVVKTYPMLHFVQVDNRFNMSEMTEQIKKITNYIKMVDENTIQ